MAKVVFVVYLNCHFYARNAAFYLAILNTYIFFILLHEARVREREKFHEKRDIIVKL